MLLAMASIQIAIGCAIVATNPTCPTACRSWCPNNYMLFYAFVCFFLATSIVASARRLLRHHRHVESDAPVVVMAEPMGELAAHEQIAVVETTSSVQHEEELPPSYGEAVVVTLDGLPGDLGKEAPATSTLNTTLLSQPH